MSMLKSMAKAVAIASGFVLSTPAWGAIGQALDFNIHQQYISPRAVGMGNAFLAVADDYSALLYNPAGLARLETWTVNTGIGGTMDKDILPLLDDISKASDKQGNDTQEMFDLFQKNYGKHYSARATVGGLWVWPRWGLAVIPVDLSLDMEIHQNIGPTASVVAYQDTTIALGTGRDLKWFGPKNRLSWGFTAKAIYRGYFNKSVSAAEMAFDNDLLSDEDANEGMTIDGDFGLLYTPEVSQSNWTSFFKYAKPTLGFTVQNIADYGFTSNLHLINDASQRAPKLQRRYGVGAKFDLPNFWVFSPRLAADLRDIGHEDWTFRKGSHIGVELLWKMFGWWRGGWRVGLNQGYLTTGFTGKLGIFMLDLVTYSEEVGSSGVRKENRRYMMRASLDF